MTTEWITHLDWRGGIYPDVPGLLIPEGGIFDGVDVLLDRPGMLRKRGGTTATGTQTAALTDIITFQSGSPNVSDAVIGVHGTGASGNKPGFAIVNTSTGAMTNVTLGAPSASPSGAYKLGKPFMHLGFLLCAIQCVTDDNWNWLMCYGGNTATPGRSVYSPTGSGGAAVVAGSNTITQSGVNFTTNADVGSLVLCQDSAALQFYLGRITAINSTTQIVVEPTPSNSFTTTTTGMVVYPSVLLPSFADVIPGGLAACSWQNRVVMGNLCTAAGGSTPQRIQWTTDPGDAIYDPVRNLTLDGFTAAMRDSVQVNDWAEVTGSGPIQSLRPIGIGQLAVYSANSLYRVTGELETESASTTDTATFDIFPISTNIGSISDKGCIFTPRGIIFASSIGVYFWDGTKLAPLMQGIMGKTYRDLLRGGATVHGAALARNHYVLSMITGATVPSQFPASTAIQFMLNLDDVSDPAWTRLSNVDLFAGCQNPADSSIYYGARWWDVTTTAPSMTGGQVIRTDTIFTPTSSNKSDADTTAVTCTIRTKAYVDGDAALLKRYTRAAYGYRLTGPGTVTVSADANIDPSESTYESLGTLPPNTDLTITAATNATPIVCTTATHSYTTGDRVVVRDGLVNTGMNGSWFITVLSGTTFSLNGSVGNGTYTANTASCNQPDTKLFNITNKLPRTFAIEHKIALSTATDRFELLDIRHGFQKFRPGRMS